MTKKTAAKRAPRQSTKPVPTQDKRLRTDSQFLDAGNLERGIFQPDDEIIKEFDEAQKIAQGGNRLVRRKYLETSFDDSIVGGEDLDVDWLEASTSGDESPVGGNPSPDQADVELIGVAVGLQYEDNEPLHLNDKVGERDKHRWELNPVSAEDYQDRVKKQPRSKLTNYRPKPGA